MSAIDIIPWRLALGYILLAFPLGICLWFKIPMAKRIIIAVLRMTLQLVFVGFYLHVIFQYNHPVLNLAWLFMMIGVADLSVLKGCGFRIRFFVYPLFYALIIGTLIPVAVFLGIILSLPHVLDARYIIPIAGMILGNCLRANIVGIGRFYQDVRQNEKAYLHVLAQGATVKEATRPYLRDAIQAALAPTTATMATIGLVALPGMMTGVILGGTDPATAIKYQIAIMLSIFSGTAITVFTAILWTLKNSFNAWGVLDMRIFSR
jgi:putative ABC transport system permease protein